jgi:adenylate kinase
MGTIRQYLLLGPQGSGKGTQAEGLSRLLSVPHISSGDMFRDHVSRGTGLGKEVEELLKAGSLVPDEVTNAMVEERLARPDAMAGFVLDGYPRNLPQAQFLSHLTSEVWAVYLTLSDDEAVRRIAGRRTCPVCGAIYHVEFKPPRVPDTCDADGARLVQRNDDTEPVVRARLATFHEQTKPLLDFYRSLGKLVEVDGAPPIPKVTGALRQVLGL